MIKFKTIVFLSFLLVLSKEAIGQAYTIKWSEMTTSRGAVYDILPNGGGEFYALRRIGSRMFPSYSVTLHEDFVKKKTGRLVPKANGSNAVIEGQEIVEGKLVVFLSDKVGDKKMFFMQEYDKELKPKGIAIKLAEYTYEKGQFTGYFDVFFSRNKDFFAVVWTIPGKRDNSDTYGYKVYDNEIIEVSEGTYVLPFDGNLSGFSQKFLSNTGDLFLAVSEFKPADRKGLFRQFTDYKATHLYHITPAAFDTYTIDMRGKRVESMTMNADDEGIFSIVGAYGRQDEFGVAGIFNLKLDFFKGEVLDENYNEFSQDFITQDWSDRQKQKASNRADRGGGEPQLYNYLMRQTEVLPDGSIVGSMEQYYTENRSTTDARGFTTVTTFYYYNDIIAFKINKGGDFDWVKKINKYQVSSNDGGPYSSYCRFIDNGKIVFIFNDNERNYDDNGVFIDGYIYSATYSRRRNAVALVTLDQTTGETKRETFFNREEVEAIAIPKMFHVDYNNREVLIYSMFRTKERFGLVKLND